jgi:hypothetical protein
LDDVQQEGVVGWVVHYPPEKRRSKTVEELGMKTHRQK